MQLVCFPLIGLQLVLCAFLHNRICAHMRATGSGFCALVRRTAQNSRNPDMLRGTYRPVDALGGPSQREVGFRRSPYGKRPTSHFGGFWRAFSPYPKTWMHKRPQCPALCWPSEPLGQRAARASASRAHEQLFSCRAM